MAPPLIYLPAPYHQPAHYRPLADALSEHGPARIPELAGLSLADKTARAQAVVDACDEPPVVVAHSFAGAVAGGLDGLGGIVFLDAFVLTEQETALALLGTVRASESAEFLDALRPTDGGRVYSIDPVAGAQLFFNGCEPDAVRRGAALLISELAENFSALPLGASWRRTPSVFVRLQDDRAWAPSLVPRMMARAGRVITVPGGHSSFFCDPAPVAAAIERFLTDIG